MKCDEAIRLIHLNEIGERSPEEETALSHHLKECSACSAEAQRVHATSHVIASLRISTPELSEPESLTRSILERTTGETPPRPKTARQYVLDAALNAFLQPAVRYAYAAVVLFSIGTLVLQQAATFQSLEALSGKLGRPHGPSGMDMQYSIPFQEARQIARTSALEPLLAATPAQVSSDRISVRKSDLEPWLSSPPSRLVDHLIGSLQDPGDDIPDLFENLQKSLSLSPILRVGGNDQ